MMYREVTVGLDSPAKKDFFEVAGSDYKREEFLLLRFFKQYPDVLHLLERRRASVCGGAINAIFSGRKVEDLDICFPNSEVFVSSSIAEFKSILGDPLADTGKAITFMMGETKLQLLKKRVGNCWQVLKSFDFTVTMAGYEFGRNTFVMHKNFFPDIARKKLCYSNYGHDTPISSLNRVLRYQGYGYSIDSLEMTKIALAINKQEFTTAYDVLDAISGVSTCDIATAGILAEARKNMSPDKEYEYKSFISETLNAEIAYYNVINALKQPKKGEVFNTEQAPLYTVDETGAAVPVEEKNRDVEPAADFLTY